ncbi:MAG: transglycosylase SLT domain-containing protein [Thermodesulfobacteriota bacterium]|nr:transglycosylase SLT domain-containing protein [Thermodesulfobacteriota bacterium]
MPPAVKIIFFCLLLFTTVLTPGTQAEAGTQFPLYPIIEPNVHFWEKVYGTYTTRQGILHDKNNLDIIYTVVDLVDWNTPGASRINKKLIKIGRLRYKKILTDLARGIKPRTREEKRIALLFKRSKHHSYHKARDSIRLQIGQKDRFLAGVIRSGAYMPSFKRIFRARGLPLELAYLPHVESSFNPKAYSKAGAAGLWQFTRSTGRDFMIINDVIDERLDLYVSTHAAARFLKENYQQLHSWPLALTAYNYGRTGMVRAQQQLGTYEKIFKSHNTALFKFASRNFYSEFLAALRVAQRLEKDPAIIKDRPWASATVRLKGFATAKDLRKYFGVSRQDFARLNPALRQPVLEGKQYIPKGYLLRLPATKAIRDRLQTIPSRIFQNGQIRDKLYTVKKGDTAASIARRHNVSLKELSRANHLNSKAAIRQGQKLKIPSHGTTASRRSSSKVITLKATAKRKP